MTLGQMQKLTAALFVLFAAACTQPDPVALRAQDVEAIQASSPQTAAGQSATLLSDGRWLFVGGQGDGTNISVLEQKSNEPKAVARLQASRSGHTATVLPDGMVLVLGGTDNLRAPGAELFDPIAQTVKPYGMPAGSARTGHTATLLQDGRLLIAGGRDHGAAATDALLWSPLSGAVEHIAGLEHERQGHLSTLLPSGKVLVRGGQSADGSDVSSAEIFDPAGGRFIRFDEANRAELPHAALADRKPEVSGVALALTAAKTDALPVVLFSKPMKSVTLNSLSVTLVGKTGDVRVSWNAAERGMLLFVHPARQLDPGADYTLFLEDLSDEQGRALPFTSLHFVTPSVLASDLASDPGLPASAGATRVAVAAVPQAVPAAPVDVSRLRWEIAEREGADDELWIPTQKNIQGKWWSTLPKLDGAKPPQAKAGMTALSGRVLRMNGAALAGVTLTAQGRTAKTDNAGFFLLEGLKAGTTKVEIDGTTANRQDTKYGYYAVRVDVAAGVTTALPYTVWMTKLDPEGTVRIPSPTTVETVISSPSIPGLELHLPPGAIIRGRDGKVVTELNVTAIPTNQPPFPLPDLGVPTYFTIQPGGATIEGATPAARGARLFYPNFRKEVPHARGTFWNYDANDRGWFIYGSGSISADATQAIPDPGVVITEFTGAMFNGSGAAPDDAGPLYCDGDGDDGNKNSTSAGAPGSYDCADPVDTYSSQFARRETDLFLPDVMPIRVRRTYRSFDLNQRMFGVGMTLDYDMFLHSENQYQETDLITPTGKKVHFFRTSPGTSWTDAIYTTQTPGKWYASVLSWNGNGWDLRFKDGAVWKFGENAPLQSITDRHGNTLLFTRNGGQSGPISRIDSPNGRWVTFQFDSGNRVIAANDSAGRTVTYAYDAAGQLTSVTNPNNETHGYTWNANHLMAQVKSAKGDVIVTNTYGCTHFMRVIRQTLSDGSFFDLGADPCTVNLIAGGGAGGGGRVVVGPAPTPVPPALPFISEIVDRAGQTRHVEFDEKFRITKDVYPKGTADERVTTFSYDPVTTLISSITDPLARTRAYIYDASGNVTVITYLAGTAAAVTMTYTYNATGDVLTSTDLLERTTILVYDNSGNLVEIHDPLGNTTKMSYDSEGRAATATNALNQIVTVGYEGADFSSITDALGRTTKVFHDAAGQIRSIVNALGQRSVLTYDEAGRLIETDDPMGNSVKFGYDVNGNMISSTDQRGNVTIYAYDAMDRRISRKDALNATEIASYTLWGSLNSFTARNGQIASLVYDTALRPTLIHFGSTVSAPTTYESMISYIYDKGDRLLAAVDSSSGEIDYAYNSFDQVTQETTSLGYVQYDFDSIGRRTQMRASQQAAVSYAYDDLDRLSEIDNAGSAVHFVYDAVNRYASIELRNGITEVFSYDVASQLSAIVYKTATATLGDLLYAYDAGGRVVGFTGSLAKVELPSATIGRTYNANNQISLPGYTYDANGRLISDGVSAFTWNARDQLIQINGAYSAQFAYDAWGRRRRKVVGGDAVQFLYDGPNIIQHLVDGAAPVATDNFLTGAGVDQTFGRGNGPGQVDYLTDHLGNTLALTDAEANLSTEYSYEVYGRASQAGVAGSKDVAFTGREDDGTGLIFMRARYYDSGTGRFLSEDPLGLAGGFANLYIYVGGNPMNAIDPSGMSPAWLFPNAFPPQWYPVLGGVGGGIAGGLTGAAGGTFVIPFFGTIGGAYGGATAGFTAGFGAGLAAEATALAVKKLKGFDEDWKNAEPQPTTCSTEEKPKPVSEGPGPQPAGDAGACIPLCKAITRNPISFASCLATCIAGVVAASIFGG
jgi:RHS repeat-associated protein